MSAAAPLPTDSPLLRRAAGAAARHPFLVAAALAAYRHRHALAEATLAAWLDCTVVQLHGLALCRRPRPTTPTFATEVQALAAFIGCDAARLAALLQEDAPA